MSGYVLYLQIDWHTRGPHFLESPWTSKCAFCFLNSFFLCQYFRFHNYLIFGGGSIPLSHLTMLPGDRNIIFLIHKMQSVFLLFCICIHVLAFSYLYSPILYLCGATSVCCLGIEISFPWSIKCTFGILETSENERCTLKVILSDLKRMFALLSVSHIEKCKPQKMPRKPEIFFCKLLTFLSLDFFMS